MLALSFATSFDDGKGLEPFFRRKGLGHRGAEELWHDELLPETRESNERPSSCVASPWETQGPAYAWVRTTALDPCCNNTAERPASSSGSGWHSRFSATDRLCHLGCIMQSPWAPFAPREPTLCFMCPWMRVVEAGAGMPACAWPRHGINTLQTGIGAAITPGSACYRCPDPG